MSVGALRLETQIASAISFVCGAATLFCLTKCPMWARKLRYPKRVLFWMTICDTVAAANYCYDATKDPDGFACGLQAGVFQAADITSWVWMPCLAVDLYCVLEYPSVVIHGVDVRAAKRHKIYHAVVWSYSVVSTIVLLATDKWGPLGIWCWWTDAWDRLIAAYLFLWIGFAIIIACSVAILRLILKLKAMQRSNPSAAMRVKEITTRSILQTTNVQRVLLTPSLFILLHLPGTARRVLQAAGANSGSMSWLLTLQTVCDPSHGTLNFLIWIGIDRDVLSELRSVLGLRRAADYEHRGSTVSLATIVSDSASQA